MAKSGDGAASSELREATTYIVYEVVEPGDGDLIGETLVRRGAIQASSSSQAERSYREKLKKEIEEQSSAVEHEKVEFRCIPIRSVDPVYVAQFAQETRVTSSTR
jgi:hypothetical protein